MGRDIELDPNILDDYVVADKTDGVMNTTVHYCYTMSSVGDKTDDVMNTTVHYCYTMSSVPTSYKEAMSSQDAEKWQKAMDEEMHALGENETYDLTTLPTDRNAVGGGGGSLGVKYKIGSEQ